jgi:acyl-CoA hydrolase/GNAT superfamily N-acetyltransferase
MPEATMDLEQLYRDRLTSAGEAVSRIRSGERIYLGSNGGAPQALIEALTARGPELADTEILHLLTLGKAPYSHASFIDHFRHNALFIGANVREAVNECRADYTPVFLSEIPALFHRGQMPLDAALVQVSPPDRHGYVSLGVSVDIGRAAVDTARHVIAEVNPRMPRTHGDSFVHLSRLAAVVESDRPLHELERPAGSEVARRIGRYIAELIEDGATIQMGIGDIPDAVLACLGARRDLGVHTEMFSDGLIELVEAGVITGRRKSHLPGKMVVSFCMGSRALYDFVDNNPAVEFRGTDYVNDPFIIARNDRMVAINTAIEIDLTGQVCADSIGERFYSGIGGQVDFIRGAARSRGGKPVIALPSTAENRHGERFSRIVPALKPGAGVVTSRGDVHYVVTEHGVAYLHGKSVRERAMALVSIAHPDYRSDLLAAARARRLVMMDVTDQGLLPRYPEELEEDVTLPDGTTVRVRPIRPTDEGLLRDFHYRLSEETVLRRYRHPLRALPHAERLKLVNVDYETHMALIAVRHAAAREEMVGVVRYHVDPATRLAELAFTVRDDWQDRGIGTQLMRKVREVACLRGVGGLEAWVQADNHRMLDLLLRNGFQVTSQSVAEERHLVLRLDARACGDE